MELSNHALLAQIITGKWKTVCAKFRDIFTVYVESADTGFAIASHEGLVGRILKEYALGYNSWSRDRRRKWVNDRHGRSPNRENEEQSYLLQN